MELPGVRRPVNCLISTFLQLGGDKNLLANSRTEDDLRKAFKLGERLDPAKGATAHFAVPDATPVKRLTEKEQALLTPEYRVKNLYGNELEFRVVGSHDFQDTVGKLSGKGFWIVFTPSGDDVRVATGHANLVVKDAVFNRLNDPLGSEAMRSFPTSEVISKQLPGQAAGGYAIAQYFELSDEALEGLYRASHDRVWFYHQNNPAYASRYNARPLSKPEDATLGENCLTFGFSWTQEHWRKVQPQLEQVRKEFGSFTYSEVPNRQIFLSPTAGAYRGTLFITDQKMTFKRSFSNDGLLRFPDGIQLLIDGPGTKINRWYQKLVPDKAD